MSMPGFRPGQAALFIFAAIGAVASAITIISFLSSGSSRLHASAYVNRLLIPQSIQRVLTDQAETDTIPDFVRMLETAFECNASETAEGKELDHTCAHLTDLETVSEKINQYGRLGGAVVEIELENRGSSRATNIRIDSSRIEDLNLERPDGEWVTPQQNESKQYLIPDLNPGESLNVLAFHNSYTPYRYSQWQVEDFLPQITYSEGLVDYTPYSHQLNSFSDHINDMSVFDWVFGTIMVIAGSIFVTILVFLPFALIDARMKGKPISSVFKPEQPADSGPSQAANE